MYKGQLKFQSFNKLYQVFVEKLNVEEDRCDWDNWWLYIQQKAIKKKEFEFLIQSWNVTMYHSFLFDQQNKRYICSRKTFITLSSSIFGQILYKETQIWVLFFYIYINYGDENLKNVLIWLSLGWTYTKSKALWK